MKNILKISTITIFMSISLFVTPLTVFGAERSATDPVIEVTDGIDTLTAVVQNANTFGADHDADGDILQIEGNMLYFVRANYKKMDYEGKKEFMAEALKGVQTSGLPATTKSKVYNFIKGRDPSTSQVVSILANDYSGDLVSAESTLEKWGVPQIVSKLLGLACMVITWFMVLSMGVDICYINLPMVNNGLTNWGKGNPKWVSEDAKNAWNETVGYGGNTNWAFLKKKFISLLFVMLILVALISGKLFIIIGNLVDFVMHILTVLGL